MSILNWPKTRPSAEAGAGLLGLMLLAWQPFWSGARLPTLLLVMLAVWMLLRKRIDFGASATRRLGQVFLLLGVPMLLSIPQSFDRQASLYVALTLGLFYLVGLGLLHGLRTDKRRAWLLRWLLILLMAWTADGYVQYLFGHDLFGHAMTPDRRIVGVFADNLHLSLFLALLLPAALWPLAQRQPLGVLAIAAAAGFIVAMSGSRSSLLLLLLGCALLLTQLDRRYRLPLALAVLAIGASVAVLSPAITQRIQAIAQTPSSASAFERIDIALSNRLTIWSHAAAMVADRPLTGVGAGAFAKAYSHYAPPDDLFLTQQKIYHAEQMYVSVAAESGLPGLAGLIAAIALCAAGFMRAPPERRRQAAPFAAPLAMIAFPLQSQPVLYTIWWFPVVLLLLCGLLAALERKPAA